MNIGIDAGALGWKDERLKVGTYQLAKNVVVELSKIDKVNQYLLFSFYPIEPEIKNQLPDNFKIVVFRPSYGFFKFRLPLEFIYKKINVYLALNQALPWFHPFKTISVVHDIAFELYPQCYPDSYNKLRLQTKDVVYNSDKIITSSKVVANDIIKFYRLNPQKIKIIPQGFNESLLQEKINTEFKKFQPFFLFVGAYKRIKNLPAILQAFSLFKKETKRNFKFIMCGSNFWFDPEIKKVIRKEKLQKDVIDLGFVDETTIKSLYTYAQAFVSPSLYEGFGLTSVDAMANNCPVVLSNQGASQEIVDKAGIFVDPKDIYSIKAGMEKLAFDQDLGEKLISLGRKKVKNYTWKNFVLKLHQLITTV